MNFNFTLTKFPALFLVIFLVDFFVIAAGDYGNGGECKSASDCKSDYGCWENKRCVNCKLAAKADEYPSGCIPWPIVIASLVIGVLFLSAVAFAICWFVASCPLYKWRKGRKNGPGARGYGGGQRSQSPRNVSKSASKTSQKPRSKPASTSASKAS